MKSNETTPESVCDFRYLKELSQGNVEFEEEMLNIFVEELPGELKIIEEAIGSGNFEEIKQTVHRLKSSLHFVGLNLLIGEEADEVEDLAEQERDIAQISLLFIKIKEYCNRAYSEIISKR